MHFYVVEYHSHSRCFSFISRYSGFEIDSIKYLQITDESGGRIINSWVEKKLERSELILAGSCFLEADTRYQDLKLCIQHGDGNTAQYVFPTPSFIDASVIALDKYKSGFCVMHWAKDSISSSTYNGSTLLETIDSTTLSKGHFFKSVFTAIKDGLGTIHTCPPQSLPVQILDIPLVLGLSDCTDERVLNMKNKHKGEDAWLIGNGPSVVYEDLEQLQNKVTFGFNRLHLSYVKTNFRPTYVVSGDNQMINDFGEEIVGKNNCTTFLASPERPSTMGDYIWLRQLSMFPSLFSLNPQTFVTAGGSSPFLAMQLAAYMGIKRIFLYGFDFNYKMDVTHEGSDSIKVVGEGNHFIDDYRSGRSWYPPSYRNIAHSFWNAKVYFESLGGEIINCTHNTKLNIFRKEDFNDSK